MKWITLKASPFPKNQITEKLEAHNIHINRYAQMFFAHSSFSTEETTEMTVGIGALEEIGLENGGTLAEIFRQTEKYGLKPCPVNTGLFLRLAWKDQPQSENAILTGTHRSPAQAVVVLSEIPEPEDGFPKGLYLRNVDGELWLRGYVCDMTYRFSGDDLFAFEKPNP